MTSSPPLIAVTGERGPDGLWQPRGTYLEAVEYSGAAHFAVQRPEELLRASGLLLTGGGDVAPRRYGRTANPHLGSVDEERDELELALAGVALDRGLPILGICRGMQVLVVAGGGTLWQDLPSELPCGLQHGRGAGRQAISARAAHPVALCPGSLAAKAAGSAALEVNSSHHQAAQTVGPRLVISGWAPDGIIEAVEMPGFPFVLGVQWHPEDLLNRPENARLFAAFVAAAAHAGAA